MAMPAPLSFSQASYQRSLLEPRRRSRHSDACCDGHMRALCAACPLPSLLVSRSHTQEAQPVVAEATLCESCMGVQTPVSVLPLLQLPQSYRERSFRRRRCRRHQRERWIHGGSRSRWCFRSVLLGFSGNASERLLALREHVGVEQWQPGHIGGEDEVARHRRERNSAD